MRQGNVLPTKHDPEISIHAPAKGATSYTHNQGHCLAYFNPRTREGCDIIPLAFQTQHQLFQSTHPRRVRRAEWVEIIAELLFQSTHPRRVRLALQLSTLGILLFQSTHPRRVRLSAGNAVNQKNNFNPRTREGCDRSSSAFL